nr:NAD(P)-dependent oxidoreductase [uncultured Holophaga sp.]
MADIAFLGLGAMGSRMAVNLLKAGHVVTVWNRSPAATAPLAEAGAKVAASPREAAAGADFVIAMVRDDEASRWVWQDPAKGAFAGMDPGAVAIDSSTISVAWAKALGEDAKRRGIPFLEAPVSGSRPQAEGALLIFLAGGEAAVFAQAEPVLKAMGSVLHHVGPLGQGALLKLATNTLMGIETTALAELLGMLKRGGVDLGKAVEVLSTTAVWSGILTRNAKSMLEGTFAPVFPVDLLEKDMRYTLEAAGEEAAPTIAASRGVFREAMDAGMAGDNHTAVARLFS